MKEQEKLVQRQIRNNYAFLDIVLGEHCSISCWFKSEPCVTLYGIPMSNYLDRRIFPKSIVKILVHESIHHALEWLDGDPLSASDASVAFDNLFPSVQDMNIFC